ncbi:MAG TPA: hemolysin family protein [Lacipirellulaceae bacterium]|jgi:CBS domain containing-hemolysin-like protein
MNPQALLFLAVGSCIASSLAAIAARALREFSRHDLQEICEQRQKLDRFGEVVRDHDEVALGLEIFVVFATALSVAGGSGWAWSEIAPGNSLWWTLLEIVAVATAILSLTNVALPWSLARIGIESFLYFTWPIWRALSALMAPPAWIARAIDALLHRAVGRKQEEPGEEAFEDEIRTIVTEGHREGLLEEEAREMIESVIDLGDVVVSHIMTPRTDMQMVQLLQPWEEIIDYVIKIGHTRIPVYDKSRDEIVGILYSKDLLPELAKDAAESRTPLSNLLRKPLFVPESKAVNDVLALFQQSRTHIAIVLDEYGGVSGLVTIEDVLEEIVGEIEDEFDPEVEDEIRKIDDDTCEAVGRAHLEEINAQMGFELPEDKDFDTIGGFVFAEFGHVPKAGETLTWNDAVRVKVLDAARRRVNRVRLERVRKEATELA